MAMLWSIVGLLVVLGLAVGFHEFGHFSMAKLFGVYVRRFSIGMGPVIWRKQKGETEYALSLLPLGGYVKMVNDVSRNASVPRERTYEGQARWRRALILVAGPMMNFVLAAICYIVIGMVGVQDFATKVAVPRTDSIAYEVGIRTGDVIASVNGESVKGFMETNQLIVSSYSDGVVRLGVKRDDMTLRYEVPLTRIAASNAYTKLVMTELGMIPLGEGPLWIAYVARGSPAAAAGLLAGDQIQSVNGFAIQAQERFIDFLQDNGRRPVTVSILRAQKRMTLTLVPRARRVDGKTRYRVGVSMIRSPVMVDVEYGPWDSLVRGVEKMQRMIALNLASLQMMGSGEIGTEHVSGPVGIAQMAGKTVQTGFIPTLRLIAILSVALGVMNLLPIPVLDGGHLFLLAIEGVLRRDIPAKIKNQLTTVGMVLLFGLMIFALNNDVSRLLQ